MAERDEKYIVLQVSKGAVINECVRCGAVIFHRTIHDVWHATNDDFEKNVGISFLSIIRKLKRLTNEANGS